LLFHLWTGGSTNSLLAAASMEQRSAIASLLTYFIETAITDDDLDTDHLLQAHSHWSS
jgi:hypothetical protein